MALAKNNTDQLLLRGELFGLGDISYNIIPNNCVMMMMNCFCVFVAWLTDERRLALFPAGTIVKDPHHRESLTRRAGFEPAQNLSSGLVE